MSGNIHISFAKIDFNCPYCGQEGSDKDGVFVNRCNKNKAWYTSTVCNGCSNRIGITYNYMGHIKAFKLTTARP